MTGMLFPCTTVVDLNLARGGHHGARLYDGDLQEKNVKFGQICTVLKTARNRHTPGD